MKRDEYLSLSRQIDVFSRGAMQLTFRTLRKPKPSLALAIQNILNSEPLTKPSGATAEQLSDHFRVDLNAEQVTNIIKVVALAASWRSGACPGQQVMLKSLLDDWMLLARTSRAHDGQRQGRV